ncbi:glucose-1-phosphate cytidylyltransferase [Primorskyibacter sp. S187A]|uniref:glucose-1-phosphate cytidylyltransferase n=1 Tax=Primorskyibacter sp. S187A TaxID=3415130 RepID=UPI003C7DDA39
MKAVILAGGRGTRLAEETGIRPKPMVEIGGKPILWHIMHIYAHFGVTEFVVAAGYKGEMIKEYFANFYLHNNDYTFDLKSGDRALLSTGDIDWKVSVVDTGLDTNTAGRVAQLRDHLADDDFMLTYGDGVANVDLASLQAFHSGHDKLATVTAVRPPARFGALDIADGAVKRFIEKPQTESGWINGGFFLFRPGMFDYLTGIDPDDEHQSLERAVLEKMSADGQLMAHQHAGFWHPMDTLRDRQVLEKLWNTEQAPWKMWS